MAIGAALGLACNTRKLPLGPEPSELKAPEPAAAASRRSCTWGIGSKAVAVSCDDNRLCLVCWEYTCSVVSYDEKGCHE